MRVLGIDPGSLKMGWALIDYQNKKINYLASGVLLFNSKTPFMERIFEIKEKVLALIVETKPDEVSLESLIYVKSPTALIKLAQTRGIILAGLIPEFKNKIFEYSPNLVKSTAVGHGHATKEGVQKFLDMMTGKREYKTFDESDALAIAICHVLSNSKAPKASRGRTLKDSLSHKIGNL